MHLTEKEKPGVSLFSSDDPKIFTKTNAIVKDIAIPIHTYTKPGPAKSGNDNKQEFAYALAVPYV